MAKTAEDNFRIEVWDRDEQALSETISRSPDLTVSQAAWQAAIRRRPGMLLIHYNSRHVMEKILTPGEVNISPQAIIAGSVHAGLDVALGDLREWHVLRAWVNGGKTSSISSGPSRLWFGHPISVSGRTVESRKCARSPPVGFDAKYADRRGRGQSVPRPVLRPALC
ncbi:hypothetical protein X727_23935 [Mesorhizobium sp. L103C119B0]|uniref:hypothetical protein n=1 Tax=Mesorhizobium sp. L103C119B0 TaxID=1287085 RepID=UPI0003CFB870|nr:hypothetical protein [Mesorhizobium sp. L103C119B0]ESZ67708.1 hypothetical protein X727_23935 [Mesorhizobium sp. L103C119B0]